jgi:ATP-dependent protease HslVU (ClpYQ) ATPase subunit
MKDISDTLDKLIPITTSWSPKAKALRSIAVQAKNEVMRVRNAQEGTKRMMPIGIIIYGDPGIGKSTLLNYTRYTHADVRGREYKESAMF